MFIYAKPIYRSLDVFHNKNRIEQANCTSAQHSTESTIAKLKTNTQRTHALAHTLCVMIGKSEAFLGNGVGQTAADEHQIKSINIRTVER